MDRGNKSKKRTGKRFLISVSCLLLLAGITGIMVFSVVKALCGWDEFDNPIDAEYMPLIDESNGEGRTALLEEYEKAWKRQLEDYLNDYRAGCAYESDKEMVDEYLDAICGAIDAQKNLMEYMNVPKEKQLWYSARIYYCSYVKDIRGRFDDHEAGAYVADIEERHTAEPESGQEAFNIEWSNKLALLTMEFYETLDEEGKRLANKWQESREQWKAASNSRFWQTPEELNAESEKHSFWENETDTEMMEVNGWINKLYYEQLESIINEM